MASYEWPNATASPLLTTSANQVRKNVVNQLAVGLIGPDDPEEAFIDTLKNEILVMAQKMMERNSHAGNEIKIDKLSFDFVLTPAGIIIIVLSLLIGKLFTMKMMRSYVLLNKTA